MDDLLNDFGSSGDEAEDQENDDLVQTDDGQGDRDANAMEVDGQHDEEDDAQQRKGDIDADDPEATKAKVEKMQLGAVKDVRSVASLMQTLEPILEVSKAPTPPTSLHMDEAFTFS